MSEYQKVDDEIVQALSIDAKTVTPVPSGPYWENDQLKISNTQSIGGIHIGNNGKENHFYQSEEMKLFAIMQENIALRMTQQDGVEFVNMQTGKTLMRLSQDGDLYIKGIVKTLPDDDNVL